MKRLLMIGALLSMGCGGEEPRVPEECSETVGDICSGLLRCGMSFGSVKNCHEVFTDELENFVLACELETAAMKNRCEAYSRIANGPDCALVWRFTFFGSC